MVKIKQDYLTQQITFFDFTTKAFEFSLDNSSDFIAYPVKVKNIPFTILDDTYGGPQRSNRNLPSQSIVLSFSDFNSDFSNENINPIDVEASLFFTKPRLYSEGDQPKMSFYVNDNFYPNTPDVLNDAPIFFNIDDKNVGNAIDSFESIPCDNECNPNLSNYDNVSSWSYELPNSMIHLINIEYDKLLLNDINDENLQIKMDADSSDVTFFGLSPYDIENIEPSSRHLNHTNNPFINPDFQITIQTDSVYNDINFSFENMNTGDITPINPLFVGEYYMITTSALSDLESGLYFMRMSREISDTSSINIERTINLDSIDPVIYSDVYSDDLSINPLPHGHDITKYDNIRFTVIEGPTYFGDSYVIHSPSNNQSPYDLSYIFNNNLAINIEVSLNGVSQDLPDDIVSEIDLDNDFSFAYDFDNQWLDIDNQSGELIYTITVEDGASNGDPEDFVYELQLSNAISLMNFFNYPNPFSTKNGEHTSFRYSLVEPFSSGTLMIYDISGKMLYTQELNGTQLSTGTQTIPWNGKTKKNALLGSGVYYGIINFNSSQQSKLIKIAIIND